MLGLRPTPVTCSRRGEHAVKMQSSGQIHEVNKRRRYVALARQQCRDTRWSARRAAAPVASKVACITVPDAHISHHHVASRISPAEARLHRYRDAARHLAEIGDELLGIIIS